MPPHEAPPDSWRWRFRARPGRIIDGDTVVMQIDLGFRTHMEQPIRITGVDTPELLSADPAERVAAQEAKSHVVMWFDKHRHDAGLLWPYTLNTDKDKMTFARYLGSVTCSEGHSLSEALGQREYL